MPDMPCPILHRYGIVAYFIHAQPPSLPAPCYIHHNRPNANQILTSVTPDLTIVPKKYHPFTSPPLRRVFLDAREDNSRVVIRKLNAEISALKERITSLGREKDILTDDCYSAHSALEDLSAGEEIARLNSYKAAADAFEDKQNLNRLMAEYNAVRSRAMFWHGLLLFSVFLFLFWKYFTRLGLRCVGLQ